jgi:hypothetical protein
VCVTIYVNIYRDALIAIYHNIQTLMCYFHVVNCCEKNLRSHPAATQKLICDEIYHLHYSVSQQEFEGRYREVSARWRIDFPEFARYFNTQWISGHFTNWKIYCSAPSIASTNNALESFNNAIKKCYTLNARHSLFALVDLFMEQLVFDISMDIKDLRNCTFRALFHRGVFASLIARILLLIVPTARINVIIVVLLIFVLCNLQLLSSNTLSFDGFNCN